MLELLIIPAVLLPEVAEGLFQIRVVWILYLVNMLFVPGHRLPLDMLDELVRVCRRDPEGPLARVVALQALLSFVGICLSKTRGTGTRCD
jgi:hypothetical protein